jgi:hypothetical protein
VRFLPEARGQGLGLKVLERLISKFGLGCRIAAMKSFPLQLEIKSSSNPDEFVQRMALDTMPGGTDIEVHKRLARNYRRAGFRSVKGTDHLMIKMLISRAPVWMEQRVCMVSPLRDSPKKVFTERSRRKSPGIFDSYYSESYPRYRFIRK